MFVMLKRNWPGNFGRSIRKKNGEVKRRIVFTPGEPIQLNAEEIRAVRDDLGVCLDEVEFDEKHRPRIKKAVTSVESSKAADGGGEPTEEPEEERREGVKESGGSE